MSHLTYPYTLPKLPYDLSALEPYIDGSVMRIHYYRNHAGYVKKLNEMLEPYPALQKLTLPQLIVRTAEILEPVAPIPPTRGSWSFSDLGNMARQHFNHCFFWESMTPHPVLSKDNSPYHHLASETFGTGKANLFGSGWVWIVESPHRLLYSLITEDGQTPHFWRGHKPLLVCDLWEHAYFCQYQTDRSKYLQNWMNIANWEKAHQRAVKGDPLTTL